MSVPPINNANRLQESMRLLQQGNAAGAVSLLELEIQDNPHNGPAFQYLGIARAQKGDVGGGIMALREASRLMPREGSVLYNLGVALAQAKQPEEARAALERSLALDPTNAKARAALEKLGFTPSATTIVPPVRPVPTGPPAAPVRPAHGFDLGLDAPMPATHPASPAMPTPPPAPPALGTVGGGMPSLGTIGGGAHTAPPASPGGLGAVGGAPPTGMGGYTPSGGSGYTGALPTASSTGMGSDSIGGGMYVPPAAITPHMMMGREPNTAERIGRGIGWGALCGQWWTLWICFWDIWVYGQMRGHWSVMTAVVASFIIALVFGFYGALVGLIIGAVNGDDEGGAMIGIGAGILCFIGETLLTGFGFGTLFNAMWWFFTGRFVGRNIGARVQQRIES